MCINCIYYKGMVCKNEESKNYALYMEQIESCRDFIEKTDKITKDVIKREAVNHPEHYNKGIEAIDIIESWDLNFSLGNAIKYILRAPHKSNQIEDLKKAKWYVEREIERLEKNS